MLHWRYFFRSLLGWFMWCLLRFGGLGVTRLRGYDGFRLNFTIFSLKVSLCFLDFLWNLWVLRTSHSWFRLLLFSLRHRLIIIRQSDSTLSLFLFNLQKYLFEQLILHLILHFFQFPILFFLSPLLLLPIAFLIYLNLWLGFRLLLGPRVSSQVTRLWLCQFLIRIQVMSTHHRRVFNAVIGV